jgi:hypothetical protein
MTTGVMMMSEQTGRANKVGTVCIVIGNAPKNEGLKESNTRIDHPNKKHIDKYRTNFQKILGSKFY